MEKFNRERSNLKKKNDVYGNKEHHIMLKCQIGLHCWITHTEYQNFVHKVFVITK